MSLTLSLKQYYVLSNGHAKIKFPCSESKSVPLELNQTCSAECSPLQEKRTNLTVHVWQVGEAMLRVGDDFHKVQDRYSACVVFATCKHWQHHTRRCHFLYSKLFVLQIKASRV